MKAVELLETRDSMYQYIKSIVPTWPDYVVKDWLYSGLGKEYDYSGKDPELIKNDIIGSLENAGLKNAKWKFIPNMKFTMDMWNHDTYQKLERRIGGQIMKSVPNDAERHATQDSLAQKEGGIRKEPVILIQHSDDDYELVEGWHRTIQHFKSYPDGYTGPAYVAKSSL